MKKLSTRIKSSKGFTLIELLVVIAVLGVLAAGVLVAINPIQRINQAGDSKTKNDIAQIAQAMQAYYTTTGSSGTAYYPAAVADLVTSSDLKTEPKDPSGNSYTVVKNPAACTTAGKNCTDVAVYYTEKAPALANGVWCWRSGTGTASEVLVAACTAP